MIKTKKLLLIAYSFPPSEDAHSLVWYNLINELAGRDENLSIYVLTIKYPKKISNHFKFNSNITVYRCFPGIIAHLINYIKLKIRVENIGNERIRSTSVFRVVKKIYKAIIGIINLLLPGDYRTEWFPFAIYFIYKNFKLSEFDYIITAHEPWVDSLIGLFLKIKKPNIKWVAEFGDPYVTIYTPKIKLFLENKLEKKIYYNADILVFNNEVVVNYLKEKYPFMKNKKIFIIEHGFSYKRLKQNKLKYLKFDYKRKNKVFTLAYTGTFFKKFRNPKNLIKALEKFDKPYKFIIAGRNELFLNEFKTLGENVEFVGVVPYHTAVEIQESADILIHLDNMQDIQVPSKFFDYIGSLNPIVNITQNLNSLTSKLIKELNCGVVVSDNYMDILKCLNELYQLWENGELRREFNYNLSKIYELSWEFKSYVLYKLLYNE